MQVHHIMTTGMTTVDRDDDLRLVDDIMAAGHIRHVPVVEDNRVVGVVSLRDVFSAQMLSTKGIGDRTQRSFLHTLLVNDVMTQSVTTISPDASVSEAAMLMIDEAIGCLPVVRDGALEGIVTKTDLLRCLHDAQGGVESPPVKS